MGGTHRVCVYEQAGGWSIRVCLLRGLFIVLEVSVTPVMWSMRHAWTSSAMRPLRPIEVEIVKLFF